MGVQHVIKRALALHGSWIKLGDSRNNAGTQQGKNAAGSCDGRFYASAWPRRVSVTGSNTNLGAGCEDPVLPFLLTAAQAVACCLKRRKVRAAASLHRTPATVFRTLDTDLGPTTDQLKS